MLQAMPFVDETTPYPTVTDFLTIFDEEMNSLYLLFLLLTGDHDKAEQCLVSAVEDCVEGIGVFMDWARSWTRGSVLKHALKIVKPAPEQSDFVSFIRLKRSAAPAETTPLTREGLG